MGNLKEIGAGALKGDGKEKRKKKDRHTMEDREARIGARTRGRRGTTKARREGEEGTPRSSEGALTSRRKSKKKEGASRKGIKRKRPERDGKLHKGRSAQLSEGQQVRAKGRGEERHGREMRDEGANPPPRKGVRDNARAKVKVKRKKSGKPRSARTPGGHSKEGSKHK